MPSPHSNSVSEADIRALLASNPDTNIATAKALFQQKDIILYGAGESSHWFFEIVMKREGFIPSVILDKRFHQPTQIDGVPALHPQDFEPSTSQYQNSILVICSGNDVIVDEIKLELSQQGYQQLITLHDIYDIHIPLKLPAQIQELGSAYFETRLTEILQAFAMMADEQSRRLFFDYLALHFERQPRKLIRRPREEQFFPADVPLSKGYQRFICCGAYDGDSLRLLQQQHGKVESIVCFEADPAIYKRLTSFVQEQKSALADNVLALPCAVYDQEKIVAFTEATGLGSRIAPEGRLQVQTVSLDHLIPGYSPTMITMDIEGAEMRALKGAEKMIRVSQPDLAISVYHAPSQLWEVPCFLAQLNPNYQYYLRNYTSFSTETILYATT